MRRVRAVCVQGKMEPSSDTGSSCQGPRSSADEPDDFRLQTKYFFLNSQVQHIPYCLVVRISGFHPEGPGSIPGMGICFDFFI